MKLFLRYILFDILKIYFAALLLLTVLLVLIIVVNEAMTLGLTMEHAVKLVPFTLPEQLRLSIPMTLLLATTVSFSRMAGNNEIIAAKSLGIAPWQLLWPVWVLAVIFSLVCVWLNDFAVTWGRTGLTGVVYRSLEDTIYSTLAKEGKITQRFGNDSYTISVERIEGKKLISPEITSHKNQSTIKMSEAEIIVDYDKAVITIPFSNLIMSTGSESLVVHNQTFTIPIPNQEIVNMDSKSPSEIPLSDMEDQAEKCQMRIEQAQRRMAALTAFALATGDSNMVSQQAWDGCEQEIRNATKRLHRIHTEPPRRWANGFSCLFFVWVGAPLAIRLQKADVFASFFACFLPILALYYPFLMLGVDQAKNGTLPPSFVWIGNLCLALVGFWFVRQIHKN